MTTKFKKGIGGETMKPIEVNKILKELERQQQENDKLKDIIKAKKKDDEEYERKLKIFLDSKNMYATKYLKEKNKNEKAKKEIILEIEKQLTMNLNANGCKIIVKKIIERWL